MKNDKEKWTRNCPECNEIIKYSKENYFEIALNKKSLCKSCCKLGDRNSSKHPKVRKKMSESKKGKNNPMFGTGGYWIGKKRPNQSKKMLGKKRPDQSKRMKEKNPAKRLEVRKKMRISRLNYIKSLYGQVSPNYNFVGCEIIRWFNMYYDFNFQHAENGGEVCIDGYFPDGVDEKRKIIIEIDEKHHFTSNGKLKEKDIKRQRYLEELGYRFIRVKI